MKARGRWGGEWTAMMGLPDGRVVVGCGVAERRAEPPEEGVAFYCNDFGLEDEWPWWVPERVEFWERDEWAVCWEGEEGVSAEWEVPEASDFAAVFQEISAEIRAGAFEKTVPVVVECGRILEGEAWRLWKASVGVGGPLTAYGWREGEVGFAGATPECLLRLEGRILKTMALAGTARLEEKEVLAVDEKEIREHEYVANSLVAKLGDFGVVRRGPRGIMELGSIVHFHTPIEVELKAEVGVGELVRKLHPTPALGPLPRTPGTMERLLEWRRRLGVPGGFGAPFGLWRDGAFDLLVAIRGIWWDGVSLRLPAGCGVIEASRLVNEWRELRLKREAVKRRFGLG